MMAVSPIARNFYRLRSILMETLNLPRKSIKPSVTFEQLIAPEKRAMVWDCLRAEGLRFPVLTLSSTVKFSLLFLFLGVATIWALLLQSWWALPLGVLEFALVFSKITRKWGTNLEPANITLGEAAICMTPAREIRLAGLRLSKREIAVKVRMLIWEATGVPFDKISPEKSFAELGID